MTRGKGHWSNYSSGTGWGWRYRYCLDCCQVWRNINEKPLLHKGRKP